MKTVSWEAARSKRLARQRHVISATTDEPRTISDCFESFGSPGVAVKYQSGRVSRPRRRSVSKQPQLLGNTQNDVWLINNTAMGFSVSRQRCQVGRCYRSSATAATATAAAFTPPMLTSRMGKHYRLSPEAKQSEGTRGLPGRARQSQQHPTQKLHYAAPARSVVVVPLEKFFTNIAFIWWKTAMET